MRTRILWYAIFIFVITLLQSTLLGYAAVCGVIPNLLLVFVVIMAFFRGSIEGACIGFFCGLAQDLATGKILGFYTLIGLYTCFIVGSLNKRLYRENLLVVVFFTLAASVAYETAVYFFAGFLHGQTYVLYPLKNVILPEGLYNSGAAVLLYIPSIWLNRKFENAKKALGKY